jgi:hypothetical protein
VEKHGFPSLFYVKGMRTDSFLADQFRKAVNKGPLVRFLMMNLLLSIFPDPVFSDRMWNTGYFNSSSRCRLWRDGA